MKTLESIQHILQDYVQRVKLIYATTQDDYNNQLSEVQASIRNDISMLRDIFPYLLQINYPENISQGYAEKVISNIKEKVSGRYAADYLPGLGTFVDHIGNENICTPTLLEWQTKDNTAQNFVINYDNANKSVAESTLNTLLLNMLLSLPVGYIHLNIVDLTLTGMASNLTKGLGRNVCGDLLISKEQVTSLIDSLKQRFVSILQECGDLCQYNTEHKICKYPYEIVVLLNYPNHIDNELNERFLTLFENGYKGGVCFVILNNVNLPKQAFADKETLIDYYKPYQLITPQEKTQSTIVDITSIYENVILRSEALRYIGECNVAVSNVPTNNVEFKSVQNENYKPVESGISVDIGVDIDTNNPVTLKFDSGDYVHGFILGQSGSGKSVLLNTIITTAINKYAPEDLMLYLMDFKGVEFNMYRGVKHTKAILVANNDPQLTVDVLRELKNENNKRIKLWQKEEVKNIDEYNQKHPESKVPQILFIADECQVMFSTTSKGAYSYNHAIQNEIADIMIKIATQGRSQGIHMLLATQQLNDTEIPGQVLKNLTECFLLMSAPEDSNKLVEYSSQFTSKQDTGICCYYHKKELQAHVHTYYAKDNTLSDAIESARNKSISCKSNGEIYLNGSDTFMFDESEKEYLLKHSLQNPLAVVGHKIGMNNDQVAITLTQDYSENLLFFGVNREEQTTGVIINSLISLKLSYQKLGMYCDFIVIDCLNNVQGKYRKILDELQNKGYCRIVGRTCSGSLFKRLTNEIYNQSATPTVLTIIGNERFAELKRNAPLNQSQPEPITVMSDISFDLSVMTDLNGGSLEPVTENNIKTYPQALKYILDEGPMYGIHTLLQVNKPANILFEDDYCKTTLDMFRHKIILRSENKYLSPLILSDDIDVENLGEEEELLRAYYCPEDGVPQLFTPFLMPHDTSIFNQ